MKVEIRKHLSSPQRDSFYTRNTSVLGEINRMASGISLEIESLSTVSNIMELAGRALALGDSAFTGRCALVARNSPHSPLVTRRIAGR